ncbi:MAG: DUF4040 domain-containing protein [Defluviitaleaceae bacterium]|nr:DUF4040 domain-containing protein [Defluviitaleaceae bacterium]
MITYLLVGLWIISALPILFEQKIRRMAIYLGIFSLITSILFLAFGAPDVALAEAAISIFSTIFFITCFEKHYNVVEHIKNVKWTKFILPAVFSVVLIFMVLRVAPQVDANTYVMEQYIAYFQQDVGGYNAITAIYLGYRLYDTVFEALMLMVAVVAIAHLSWHTETAVSQESRHIQISRQARNVIRIICPLLPLFGIYLIANGHVTAGGGFQGGVALAAFFVCRYMTYGIHDLPFKRLLIGEKLVLASIIILSVFVVFIGFHTQLYYVPMVQTVYLITMNTLIGIKVALGFIMLFYRFIVERT